MKATNALVNWHVGWYCFCAFSFAKMMTAVMRPVEQLVERSRCAAEITIYHPYFLQ